MSAVYEVHMDSTTTTCVGPDEFRDAMQQVAATVSIVTTTHLGRHFGMTATAVCSVSVTPPALLVCINKDASIYRPLMEAGTFCVNVLRDDQTFLAQRFSSADPAIRAARFDSLELDTNESAAPGIAGALVQFHCDVSNQMEVGSHTVVLGLVQRIRYSKMREQGNCSLLYAKRGFARVAALEPRLS